MIIYITTNVINGKKYIGKDIRNKSNYLGSGVSLLLAIKKYGKENFKKEILEECKTEKELNQREIYWITYYNAVKSTNYYNLSKGGSGGDYLRQRLNKSEIYKKISNSLIKYYKSDEGIENRKNKANRQRGNGKPWGNHTEKTKQLMSNNHADFNGENNPFYGKLHNKNSKTKMSKSRKQLFDNEQYRSWYKESLKNLYSLMTDEERKSRFGHNKGKSPWNHGKRGYKNKSKSTRINEKFGHIIVKLKKEKMAIAKITREINKISDESFGDAVIINVLKMNEILG